MLPIRQTTAPRPSTPASSPPRKFSPEFTRAFTDPEYREQNRQKAITGNLAENKTLTWKQKKFIAELLADPNRNATKAAMRAGYSEGVDTAYLLNHPQIRVVLQEENRKVFQKLEITREKVLQEVATLAFSNLDNYLVADPEHVGEFLVDLSKASVQQLAAVRDYSLDKSGSTGKVRIQLHDKLASLNLLGKYLRIFEDTSVHKHVFSVQFLDRLVKGEASFADLDLATVVDIEPEEVA